MESRALGRSEQAAPEHPRIGIVGATAIAATVTDPKVFDRVVTCSLDRDRTAARADRWQPETGADRNEATNI